MMKIKTNSYSTIVIIFCISTMFSCGSKMTHIHRINKYNHNGEKNGLWIFQDSLTQQTVIANYANDKLNGAYNSFHDNGFKAIEGFYKRDLKVRTWKRYARDGGISSKSKYRKGKIGKRAIYNLPF